MKSGVSRAEAKWYVYELIDPRNDEVFYVGKGSGNRIDAHGRDSDNCNDKKTRKIKSIGSKNVIRRKFASFWSEQEAYICESDRICELFSKGNLTNLSIATTLAKKRDMPAFSIKECISFIKGCGFTMAFPSSTHEYNTLCGTHTLPDSFIDSMRDNVQLHVAMLSKWSKLGYKVPVSIKSRNVNIDLSGVYG